MQYKDFSTNWYFNELPKMKELLKLQLIEQTCKKSVLTIQDYVNLFFGFFQNENAFAFFQDGLVERDKFSFSANFKFGQSIFYFEREFWLNPDIDETFSYERYEIHLQLELAASYDHLSFEEYFEIDKDEEGCFSVYERQINPDEFKSDLLKRRNIEQYLSFVPASIRLYTNANV